MNGIAIVARAVLCGVLTIGVTMATGCSSHDRPTEARNFGTVAIPLRTTVGSNTYRLDAVFAISSAQTYVTLVTSGDELVLSTVLPTGSYSASLQSFTLSKGDGTGTFNPVAATVVSSTEPFTVFADSTTTVNFQFETEGTTVSTGSGSVDITFGVTETAGQCTVLGPGCPDGYWCAPPALTGMPAACLLGGTTPIGSACASPLECVAPSTCHDFGVGPICTALCTPAEFGQPCASGGSCVEADPSYGLCTPETACNPISVDRVARTVRSGRFFLDFSNAVASNPEDLDVLQWAGASSSGSAGDFGPNLTQSFAVDACSSGNVAFFGNSLVPPDVDRGGQVLVGAGSTGTWEQGGASIVIHSTSSGCAASVPAAIETRYTFREGAGADTIDVERSFDFGSTPLNHPFRPFVPRLDHANFDQILHPDPSGTILLTEPVSNCPYGCGLTNWDGSWLAYYASSGPAEGLGMIMLRAPFAPGLNAALWVDYDGGFADTNSSSVELYGGTPQQVTEHELLCFFNAETWTPSLTLPAGCTLDLACNGAPTASPCEPNPCQHGGTCSEVPGGHTCTCLPGINGKNCDLVFTQIESGLTSTCGIRTDGKMACWGNEIYSGQWPPTDTFQSLAASVINLCAVHTGGAVECWRNDGEPGDQAPDLSFTSVAPSGDGECGILTNGTISCWGKYSLFFDPPPPGSFQAMSWGSTHICALGADQKVTCWGLRGGIPASEDFGQTQPPAGTFLAVRSGITASCGLRTDHTIVCWGATSNGMPLVPPSGTFIALDYRSDYGCGVRTDHTLACWGIPGFGTETTPPPGTYTSVATGYYHPCAIDTNGSIVCWGEFAGPEWALPPTGQP